MTHYTGLRGVALVLFGLCSCLGCSTDVVVASRPDSGGGIGSDGNAPGGEERIDDPAETEGGDASDDMEPGTRDGGGADAGEVTRDLDGGEGGGDPDPGPILCPSEDCAWPPTTTTCGTSGALTGRCVMTEGACLWEATDCALDLCAQEACGDNPPGEPTRCDDGRSAGTTGRCLPTAIGAESCEPEILTCSAGADDESPDEGSPAAPAGDAT